MTTKKKTRRKSAANPRDTRTVEFTPAQFLGAIVTLVCFGLVCFILGIIVNRVDNSRRDSAIAKAQEVRSGEGQQVQASPAPATSAPVKVEEAPPVRTKKEEFKTIPVPEGAKRNQAIAESAKVEEKPAEKPPEPEPMTTAQAPTEEKPPPAPPVQEEKPAPEASTPTVPNAANGNWTIQIAAYSAESRDRAEAFIKSIAKDTGITPKLVPSPDGKWLRVWIGQFTDKAEAEEMKIELQDTPALKDSIVKPMG